MLCCTCAGTLTIRVASQPTTREDDTITMSGQPKTVHVPYTLEQDEDGIWSAHAWLGSSGGANGNGPTAEDAVADLREAVQMVIDEDGIPEQLARTLELEVA